jgi:hypothetical protein
MNSQKAVAKEALVRSSNTDKDFVLQCCADLAEAGYGFLHQSSGRAQHLYLVSGEVYRIGESNLTRIR